jgi:hypothetical protein
MTAGELTVREHLRHVHESTFRTAAERLVVIEDIDDVQLPWLQRVHEACAAAGLTALEDSWTSFAPYEGYGCTKGEWLEIVESLAVPGGMYHGDPYPGVVEANDKLLAAGADLHFVTARGFFAHSQQIREWTREWVAQVYPGRKITLWFAQDKGRIAKQIGATHGIDDRAENIIDLWEEGVEAYLMTQPHNATDPYFTPDFPYRVNSVNEFVERILHG